MANTMLQDIFKGSNFCGLRRLLPNSKNWIPQKKLDCTVHNGCECVYLQKNEPAKYWTPWKFTAMRYVQISYSNPPAKALSVVCSTFQALYVLFSPYLSVILPYGCPSWRSWAPQLDHNKSLHCMCLISTCSHALYHDTGSAHTSCTHYNWILELMSSLRSNYTLYLGTMPLMLLSLVVTQVS